MFSPDGAYTSIAPPATLGRRANLTHSVPQGSQTRPTQGITRSHPPKADKVPSFCFVTSLSGRSMFGWRIRNSVFPRQRNIGCSAARSPMLPCGELGFRRRRIRKSKAIPLQSGTRLGLYAGAPRKALDSCLCERGNPADAPRSPQLFANQIRPAIGRKHQ